MALAQGETVLTIGRLLGHRKPATTLKYTHMSNLAVQDAADAGGAVLERQVMAAKTRRLQKG